MEFGFSFRSCQKPQKSGFVIQGLAKYSMFEPPRQAATGFDRAIAHRFNQITLGFWRGPSAPTAWFYTIGLAGFLTLKLFVDVGVNRWNRWFFDALEHRDLMEATQAAGAFALLIVCLAGVGVGIVRTRETLQVHWREWCTGKLLDLWVGGHRYFRMTRAQRGIANPEYRISDDVRQATEPVTDFAIGMFSSLISAATFIGILWSVGGAFDVSIGGNAVTIPAFMVVGAFIYGIFMSCVVPIVGRRLTEVTAARNESEALFRAQTIQLREGAESVALSRADDHARKHLDATYAGLVVNWLRLVRQHGNLTWVMNANVALIPVAPLLLAMPKYMQGQLSLGEVVQLASAFVQVQYAIGWLADNYRSVAEWFAAARRVVELVDALEDLDTIAVDDAGRFVVRESDGDSVVLDGLTLRDRGGRAIIEAAGARFARGQIALISGETGAGKSVLTRAILGFWPWGEGALGLPEGAPATMAHAAPWLPEGTLEEAIMCPAPAGVFTHREIGEALGACGAGHLTSRLEDRARWMQSLSAGEKQRCAIARLILTRPQVILLEDAMSACDAAAQAALTRLVFERCADSIIIDVSNRPAPMQLYDRTFTLTRHGEGASRLTEQKRDGARGAYVVAETNS